MTTFLQNLNLGESNNILGIFFLCGMIAYYVDFKVLQKTATDKRQTTFSKVFSLSFIYGSIFVFILLKILGWTL